MTQRILPHQGNKNYVAYVGMETDLIFNHGIDLPGGFASFPLLEKPDTRALMLTYSVRQIELAESAGCGTILETATWLASRDRAPEGYTPQSLAAVNRDAVALMVEARKSAKGPSDILISGCVGPRSDGYLPTEQMSVDESIEYHTEQISSLRNTAIDLISGYTLTYVAEAIGIARAALSAGYPVVISLTVETDGRLPTGTNLHEAIDAIDAETESQVAYFMVNCAHPDHFSDTLIGHPRLRGVVVNASRCSHAELDEIKELDDGNPDELGAEIASMIRQNPKIVVFGGCCGTDFRHLSAMAREVALS